MADDPAQKKDKPSEEEAKGAGKGATEAKATTAKAKAAEKAEATEQRPPKKAKAPRKPKTPKAKATAAAETGVGKEAAEAAEKSPAGQKQAPASRSRARDRAEAKRAKAGADAPVERVLVHANAKYVRTSARKARLVCDHIRGKSVDEAFAILAHTPRHVAEDWRKLLQSAVANAEHNHELLGDDLKIASVKADEGPTLKRFRPRAMGRATKIRKRTSHLTISLTAKD